MKATTEKGTSLGIFILTLGDLSNGSMSALWDVRLPLDLVVNLKLK